MSFSRAFVLIIALLFSTIILASMFKGKSVKEVPLEERVEIQVEEETAQIVSNNKEEKKALEVLIEDGEFPEADRIGELFRLRGIKLPFVETITYKSNVSWLQGRPAWLSDYASHYKTSRHFIARSLNGKPDYLKQDVAEGDRFNVLNPDKNIQFLLVVDLTRSKMWFYSFDADANERILLKSYDVGLGRADPTSLSGYLTPLGKYMLGDKIAIYRPTKMGHFNGEKVEMIRVFGTRWIPFDEEISGADDVGKGLGLHGLPWLPDAEGELVEDTSSLSQHSSDGCIRLATRDIEELFAIVITRPTTIEIVKNFREATLPGVEKP